MSEKDIDKGTVWLSELAKALAGIKLGIICLTPESLSEPWVLFETGVIFKGLDESRVWTYLLDGLKPADVPLPLGLFQHTVATEADTFRLLQSINEAMDDRGVSSETLLKKQFEKYWPELNKELSSRPASMAPIPKSLEQTAASFSMLTQKISWGHLAESTRFLLTRMGNPLLWRSRMGESVEPMWG